MKTVLLKHMLHKNYILKTNMTLLYFTNIYNIKGFLELDSSKSLQFANKNGFCYCQEPEQQKAG